MFKNFIANWRKIEYSKKLANVIIGFTFLFFTAGLACVCIFTESAVQIVALLAVFVSIPVTTVGFFYNKAKTENEIKLHNNLVGTVDTAFEKATEYVAKIN